MSALCTLTFVGSKRPSASKGTKRTQSEDSSAPNAKVKRVPG